MLLFGMLFSTAISVLSGCLLYNEGVCTECENGYILQNGFCISYQEEINPESVFSCTSDVCLVRYNSSYESITISTDVTTLILPEIPVKMYRKNSALIGSIISGSEITFIDEFEIKTISLSTINITSRESLKVKNLNINSIDIGDTLECDRINSRNIYIDYDDITSQDIETIVVSDSLTFYVEVTEDQEDKINKKGLFLFENTEFENNSSQSLQEILNLVLIVNGKEKISSHKFYDSLCDNVIAAFLPDSPEDVKTTCPDYIFVAATTEAWWISGLVFLLAFLITITTILAYIIITSIVDFAKERKKKRIVE
ncbi:Auto-transporter adhesin head GIN domain-containing protein [Entamoeba marina]